MSVRVNFHLISPLFLDEIFVPVDWTFPFLPRVGERIGGWIWIQDGRWDQAKIEKELTDEGEKHLALHRERGFEFDDWLYEVSMECGKVYGITYAKYPDSPPGDIIVDIWVNETGEPE